jgi:hypothetical protein
VTIRIARGFDTAPIQRALARIPEPIQRRLEGTRIVAGADPVYAGVHWYEWLGGGDYGVSIAARGVAHCVYPNQHAHASPTSTVVLPPDFEAIYGEECAPAVVAHEFGHALHETLGLEPAPEPVTAYAETNHEEAFAEAFAAWCFPDTRREAAVRLARDGKTLALFEELAR